LADIAEDVGLDRSQALEVLADQRYAQQVRSAEHQVQQQGIQSVPAIIFNQRHLVSGAQGVDNFKNIITQLTSN
jgi:predicted DsbA family dithiol-disulfide isomerase